MPDKPKPPSNDGWSDYQAPAQSSNDGWTDAESAPAPAQQEYVLPPDPPPDTRTTFQKVDDWATHPHWGPGSPTANTAKETGWEGFKAGLGGDAPTTFENADERNAWMNAHPNNMIPGSNIIRDLGVGNWRGALGRVGGAAASLAPSIFGGRNVDLTTEPIPEANSGIYRDATRPPSATNPEFAGEEIDNAGMPKIKLPTTPEEYINATTYSGERPGVPYQPNPHYAPPTVGAAPIPPRSGLMLSGEVMPELGSVENPGVFSKIPLRVNPRVLAEERAATAQAIESGSHEPIYRDATVNLKNIPEFAGEEEPVIPPPQPIPHEPVRPKPGIARQLNRGGGRMNEFGGAGRGGSVWSGGGGGGVHPNARPTPATSATPVDAMTTVPEEKPFGTIVKSPSAWQQHDQVMNVAGKNASEAGTIHAGHGSLDRRPLLQGRIQKRIVE